MRSGKMGAVHASAERRVTGDWWGGCSVAGVQDDIGYEDGDAGAG
jgi:hypothetical protein